MGTFSGQTIEFLDQVFEHLADVVFCIKDPQGAYRAVNSAFVVRAGATSKAQMIGKNAHDFFAHELALVYDAQDQDVFLQNQPVIDQLEQITNADGSMGWYLASKFPMRNAEGTVVGLVGISQDLHTPSDSELEFSNLTRAVEFIKQNLEQPLKVEQIAEMLDLSVEQLDRRMKKVFRLSTKKYIMKARLEKASALLLHSQCTLAEISTRCGFNDQSAFTRQFKATFMTTPAAFRNLNCPTKASAGD